jgi:hypothetical protein
VYTQAHTCKSPHAEASLLIERPIPAGLHAWCLETWPLGAVAVAESLLAGAFAAGGAFAGGAFFGAVTCHRADCPLTGNCGAFLGGGATAASIV